MVALDVAWRYGKSGRRTPRAFRQKKRSPTQLEILRKNIAQLQADVGAVQNPVDQTKEIIHDVKAPLLVPKKVGKALGNLRTVLRLVRAVARAASFIPGPAGRAAKVLDKGLNPLLGPPAPGAVKESQDAAKKIDNALGPARKKIETLEKPVNKASDELATIQHRLKVLREIDEKLIKRYGNNPPPDVEGCVKKINDALAQVMTPMARIKRWLGNRLSQVASALGTLARYLATLGKIAGTINRVLGYLNKVTPYLNRLKPILKKLEWAYRKAKWLFKQLLKKFGINLGKIEKFFNDLINRINPLKGVMRQLKQLVDQIRRAVSNIPEVTALAKILKELQGLSALLDREIEKIFRSACRNVLL
ncbi:MAG: hypothetical protein ACE5FE_06855 [Acidiferrobacterales bacterium]